MSKMFHPQKSGSNESDIETTLHLSFREELEALQPLSLHSPSSFTAF